VLWDDSIPKVGDIPKTQGQKALRDICLLFWECPHTLGLAALPYTITSCINNDRRPEIRGATYLLSTSVELETDS